jgi:polygalacturonase
MSCYFEAMRHRGILFSLSIALLAIAQPAWSAEAIWKITDFGAIGDGKTLNTVAFQQAIAACTAAGGGKVAVPAGTFLTGPIELKSNVDLDLDAAAIILFSRNFDDYPLARVNWEGRDTVACRSPLWGDNLHDVSVTGKGNHRWARRWLAAGAEGETFYGSVGCLGEVRWGCRHVHETFGTRAKSGVRGKWGWLGCGISLGRRIRTITLNTKRCFDRRWCC